MAITYWKNLERVGVILLNRKIAKTDKNGFKNRVRVYRQKTLFRKLQIFSYDLLSLR